VKEKSYVGFIVSIHKMVDGKRKATFYHSTDNQSRLMQSL
jgi:hypothetical protein